MVSRGLQDGGAVHLWNSSATLTTCTLSNNRAVVVMHVLEADCVQARAGMVIVFFFFFFFGGGGLQNGGAINFDDASSANLTRWTLADSSAEWVRRHVLESMLRRHGLTGRRYAIRRNFFCNPHLLHTKQQQSF